MRILFLSDNFPPETNAPAARVHEHAVRWVRGGHQVTVLTCAPNFPEGELHEGYTNRWRAIEDVEGVRVVRVKTFITANEGFFLRTLDYLSFMVMAFATGLFEPRPDVVVATSPQFFSAVAGWALSVAKRRPFVFELRDLWPASITAVGAMRRSAVIRALERLELFLYRRAAAIVSVTESFREELVSRGIDRGKIHVIVNGVDLARFEPRPRDAGLVKKLGLDGRFVVGYLGTHGMAHGLPAVLEAASRLEERRDIAFLFAGSGAERSRVEQVVSERRLSNVRLVARQPKDKMPALWSVCDVSLVPLRNSPLFTKVIPSKMFESMAMGVPIVMSLPEGEATRLVCGTGAGVCVPPEDADALARAIRRLADQPQLMAGMREAALKAAPRFSRDAGAAAMGRVLEAVCAA
jgi:glycosyltransferase involved in cell wall biosynthesis